MIKEVAQRRIVAEIISIREYLLWKQPGVAKMLLSGGGMLTTIISSTTYADDHPDDFISFTQWKYLMEEPPKPGIGGGD